MRAFASAVKMFWSGIPSGPGPFGSSHASVHAFRSMRAGLPVYERDLTVSDEVASSIASTDSLLELLSAVVSQSEPVHTPCAPSASEAAI
jgi:hypothetical protein